MATFESENGDLTQSDIGMFESEAGDSRKLGDTGAARAGASLRCSAGYSSCWTSPTAGWPRR